MNYSTLDCKLSVVIVNFNSGAQLGKCLNSLWAQGFQDFEVIIIDNASHDDSIGCLIDFNRISIIKNPTNRGFAAGQNQGIVRCYGKYILALNYDLIMTRDFLQNLVDALESAPDAGWACGKLLSMGPSGEFTNVIYAVGHQLPPNRFPLLKGNGEVDSGQYEEKGFVFGASGAAALYRREFIDDLKFNGQFFDESFFTWCEDVDVDWRGQNRGWTCLYVPTAVAYHQGHVGETYQEPFLSFRAMLSIRNRWLMILANEKLVNYKSNWKELAQYEFGLFRYVITGHLLRAYLKAVCSLFALLPVVISKRKRIFSPVVK